MMEDIGTSVQKIVLVNFKMALEKGANSKGHLHISDPSEILIERFKVLYGNWTQSH